MGFSFLSSTFPPWLNNGETLISLTVNCLLLGEIFSRAFRYVRRYVGSRNPNRSPIPEQSDEVHSVVSLLRSNVNARLSFAHKHRELESLRYMFLFMCLFSSIVAFGLTKHPLGVWFSVAMAISLTSLLLWTGWVVHKRIEPRLRNFECIADALYSKDLADVPYLKQQ